MALLIGVLIASTVSFVVMGLRQLKRTRRLASKANEMDLRFSADDPFDIARRYAEFTLMHSGHSARAYNVAYGRTEGVPLREFDFRSELGHGTRRLTRHYCMVVLETHLRLPGVLMWKDTQAPALQRCDGRLGLWNYRGSGAMADVLAGSCGKFADDGVSMEVREGVVLLCAPGRMRGRDYTTRLDDAMEVLRAVRGFQNADQADTTAGKDDLLGRNIAKMSPS